MRLFGNTIKVLTFELKISLEPHRPQTFLRSLFEDTKIFKYKCYEIGYAELSEKSDSF